ncbi:MAG TPA: glutaredoxin [Kofleriaceae bacterium]|jgi:glutaredoxin
MSESERDDQKWTSRASTKLVAMLNRADEIGGELRDYVQDKMANDPRYVSARKTVARWLGRHAPSSRPAPPPAPYAPPKPAAAPVVDVAKSRGFGDPGIKAQIFGKRSCPWSGRAISLLERHKVDFDFVDLEEPEHEAKLAPLSIETHQNTVPYVYLRGKFIGGFNALSEIERLGQLEVALMSPQELAAAPAHVRAVEVVPRPNTDEVAPAEVGIPPTDGSG